MLAMTCVEILHHSVETGRVLHATQVCLVDHRSNAAAMQPLSNLLQQLCWSANSYAQRFHPLPFSPAGFFLTKMFGELNDGDKKTAEVWESTLARTLTVCDNISTSVGTSPVMQMPMQATVTSSTPHLWMEAVEMSPCACGL